jgi:hypothetical protein
MKEMMPKALSPEEERLQREKQEQEDQYAAWMEDYPETVIPPEQRRECGPEVEQFKGMVSSFEATYPLAELHAITEITSAEMNDHPLRTPAKNALIPIQEQMKLLEKETDISAEGLKELKALWKRLSQAVGMINAGKVDHTRG